MFRLQTIGDCPMAKSTRKFATSGQIFGVSKMLAFLYVQLNDIERYHYKKLVSRFQAVIYSSHPKDEVPVKEIEGLFKAKSLDTPYGKVLLKSLKKDGLGKNPAKGKETKPKITGGNQPALSQLVLL